ncbi:MAG: AEC family transporter [Alphaproteobacteria bacterium]
MIPIATALLPVFGLIVLGYGIRRSGWLGDDFWLQADNLTYWILFPTLLLHTVSRADLATIEIWPTFFAIFGAIVVIATIQLILRTSWPPMRRTKAAAFTSVFQSSIRPNTYAALAIAASLFGQTGLALAAIGIAAATPLVNVLSVIVLAREVQRGSHWHLVSQLARNPIILSVAAGAILNVFGGLPVIPASFIEILGRAALPLGLLSVGAALQPAALSGAGTQVLTACFTKLFALPAAAIALAGLLGVTGPALIVTILFTAVPTSASSYILARQMGGDHQLIAGILTLQTLAAFFTLPIWLLLAN